MIDKEPPKVGPYGMVAWGGEKWTVALTPEGQSFLVAEMARWTPPWKVAYHLCGRLIGRLTDRCGVTWDEIDSLAYWGWVDAAILFDPSRCGTLSTLAAWHVYKHISRKNVLGERVKKINRTMPMDDEGNSLLDILESSTDRPTLDRKIPDSAFSRLTRVEKFVVEMTFGLNGHGDHTRSDVAKMLGVSSTTVGKVLIKAIAKIEDAMLNIPNLEGITGKLDLDYEWRTRARFNFSDRYGKRFGTIQLIKPTVKQGVHFLWECRCSCGHEYEVRADYVKRKSYKCPGCSGRGERKKPESTIDVP